MHLCVELIAVSMMLEPLGEVGANFSLQLSSGTQFTKINNKKVIAENQCEKHKKSSLVRDFNTPGQCVVSLSKTLILCLVSRFNPGRQENFPTCVNASDKCPC